MNEPQKVTKKFSRQLISRMGVINKCKETVKNIHTKRVVIKLSTNDYTTIILSGDRKHMLSYLLIILLVLGCT